jgi:thiol-disulfide isomerase/thioredoxin
VRNALRLLTAACLLLTTGALASCSADQPTSGEGGFIGSSSRVTMVPPDQRKPTAAVSGTRLGSKQTITSSDFAGKVLVINVWGSWCPPCRREAPDLQAASEQTRGTAAFLGITTKDYDPAPAEAFVRAFSITYPSIYDPTGKVLLAFSADLPPSAIPSTLVIDRRGRLAARILSTISRQTLVDIIGDVAAGR